MKIITENSLNADGDITAIQLAQSYDETKSKIVMPIVMLFRALIDSMQYKNILSFCCCVAHRIGSKKLS